MPQISPAAMLQLVLLLSAVPAQYLISKWSGSTTVQRFHATTRLLKMWRDLRSSYLNTTAWIEWTTHHISKIKSFVGLEEKEAEEEENAFRAIEQMMDDNDVGFFGASKERRSRPMFVFLRVGDVVMEKSQNRVGVVVSWDPELRAPHEWIEKMYSEMEGYGLQFTPHYKVLFNGPFSSSVMIGYLPQTRLQRIYGMRPDIPTLENYFTHFDGNRFVMQPWLREIYPEDQGEEEDL